MTERQKIEAQLSVLGELLEDATRRELGEETVDMIERRMDGLKVRDKQLKSATRAEAACCQDDVVL